MAQPRATVSSTHPALYVLLGCSLMLNAVLLFSRGGGDQPPAATAPVAESAIEKDIPPAVAVAGAPRAGGEEATPPADAASAPSAAPVAPAATGGEWRVLHGKVEGSIARTFQLLAGEDADALSSVFTRLFVWDLDLRRDLQAGDALAVVWRPAADGLPEVAAATLHSQKFGRTITAYRWKAPADRYASYWDLDGQENPRRLVDSPLANYEQITSLLKDRPTHKGMDFKTPVGTEVTSPRAGTVTRSNWNWGANGNCIEIRYDDGVLAKFLHLSENHVNPGDRVAAGQVIALSGNTGHSTAPHLHYQLDRGDKTVDPIDYHGVTRRSLDAEQTAALGRDVEGLRALLTGGAGA
jgi:murein DD-endopeptidase